MGNCVCQQTSRDTQADQSFDNSSTCHRDFDLDSIDIGIVCRIQNVRRNRNSSNDEDGTISDKEDDQISLEDSASIHDGIDTHTESSNELHSTSERVLSPLIVRQISFNSPESLHEEPRREEESNREDLSNDSFVGQVTALSRYRRPNLDYYDRQNERIAQTYDNIAVDNDIQQSINESNVEIFEMESDDDIDSVGDSNDNIDDVEILFVDDNTADSSDKRVYVDGNSCGICVSEYDEDGHKRVTLPCGHVLCLHCVRKISKRKHYRIMECPMDRIDHSITVKIAGKTVFEERNVENRRLVVDPWDYYRMIDYRPFVENMSFSQIFEFIEGQRPYFDTDEISDSENFENYETVL